MLCPWVVLGATSVTPTMLRLTSPFGEGDGRFVLILDAEFRRAFYGLLTFKSYFIAVVLWGCGFIYKSNPSLLFHWLYFDLTWRFTLGESLG